ncbi:MAG: hypothetical protein ACRECD_01165 [Burkholderiaceae bacterium]
MTVTLDARKTGLYNPAAVAITGGTIKLDNGTAAAPSYAFASQPSSGMFLATAGVVGLVADGQVFAWGDSSWGFRLSTSTLGLGIVGSNTADVRLERDAANSLAQRNGVNAQAGRTYTSFTDGSNYERFGLNTALGVITLAAESAGTGSANIDLALSPLGTGRIKIANGMTANGTVATALSSVGPTGASTTVQEWLAIKNAAGTVRYIPCF